MIAMLVDNHYGPDRRVAFECALLKRAGISSRVVAWDRRDEAGENPHSPEAEIVRVRLASPPGGGLAAIGALIRWSVRVFRDRQRLLGDARLLVAHDVFLLPLGFLLSRRLGIPLVYDAHEDFDLMASDQYPKPVRRLVTWLESALARRAAVVVVPGESRVPRWAGVARQVVVFPNLGTDQPKRTAEGEYEYDLVHCGGIAPVRGIDLLLDLAERRPDLRVAVAGSGRTAPDVAARAEGLPNADFLAWVSDPDALLSSSRAIFYCYDPRHPYSAVACPNTLYQAVALKRPLVFSCRGEPEALNDKFRIGVAAAPTPEGLEAAFESAMGRTDWQFDEAWDAVASDESLARYVAAIRKAAA